jgi:hypothetical protein
MPGGEDRIVPGDRHNDKGRCAVDRRLVSRLSRAPHVFRIPLKARLRP